MVYTPGTFVQQISNRKQPIIFDSKVQTDMLFLVYKMIRVYTAKNMLVQLEEVLAHLFTRLVLFIANSNRNQLKVIDSRS